MQPRRSSGSRWAQISLVKVDKEFEEEEKEAAKKKVLGKKTKRALKKREKNYLYDSDSSHPYSTSV
jgi:transcription initiation factor TFIIF subunit alpha